MVAMMDMNWLLAAIAVVIAGLVRGFSGFGAGLILVPSLSLLYNPLVAVVSVVIMELIPALQLVPKAAGRCHWRSVLPMSLAALVTVPLGSWLLVVIDEHSMRLLISLMVLLGTAVLASGWRYQPLVHDHKAPLLTGAVSGILSGATGLGGLPVILYYLSGSHKAEVTRASMVMFLFVTVLMSLSMFIYHGIISREILMRCLSLAPLLLLATWAGGRVFGKVSENTFRNVLLMMLTTIGMMTLVF